MNEVENAVRPRRKTALEKKWADKEAWAWLSTQSAPAECDSAHSLHSWWTFVLANARRVGLADFGRRDARLLRYFRSCGGFGVLLKLQGGNCALCKEPLPLSGVVVEHDHKTKQIRGLVHSDCNFKVFGAGESLAVTKSVKQYLEQAEQAKKEPRLWARKPHNTLSREKAARAHYLALLKGVNYWTACELVFANPDGEYPEEIEASREAQKRFDDKYGGLGKTAVSP